MTGEGFMPWLRRSRLARSLPELWAAVFYGDEPLPLEELGRILVDGLSQAHPPQEVFRQLLQRGDLTAAAALVEHEEFRRSVSEEELRLLAEGLGATRMEQVQKVELRCELLSARAQCAGMPVQEISQQLAAVRKQAENRMRDAEAALARIDSDLRQHEAEAARRYRQELFERLRQLDAGSSIVRHWQSRIVRELERDGGGDLCLIRWLLEAGPEPRPELSVLTAPPRPDWPYSDPPDEVIRWFRGEREPVDFARWRLRSDDERAWRLLDALGPLLADPVRPSAADVGRFAAALEEWLGVPVLEDRQVEEEKGCLFTTTNALLEPRLPALARAEGLLLVVATGTPLATLGRLPAKLFLLLELAKTVGKPRWCLSFGPQVLFSLLGDMEDRQRNFLRRLASQIPLDWICEDRLPAASAAAAVGRDTEVAAVRQGPLSLVIGPRGIGTSSLLLRVATELAAEGWQTLQLAGNGVAPERLCRELGRLHVSEGAVQPLDPGWLAGLRPPGVFVAVEIGDLRGLANGGRDLIGLLAELAASGGGRIRCAVTAPSDLTAERAAFLGVAYERVLLGPLPDSVFRSLLADFQDLLSLSFESSDLVDRFVFLAGGHPSVFYLLLNEVLQRKGSQHPRGRHNLTEQNIEAAWRGSEFRRRCREILLNRTLQREELRFTLDCLLELIQGDQLFRGVPRAEMESWLQLYEHPVSALISLIEEGLAVSRGEGASSVVRLPPSGLGHLIGDLFRRGSPSEAPEFPAVRLR